MLHRNAVGIVILMGALYFIGMLNSLNVSELCVICGNFCRQRFGMDTASDTQQLRDEFHDLENQMGILQKELDDAQKQLADEKHNSEIVIILCITAMFIFLLKTALKTAVVLYG